MTTKPAIEYKIMTEAEAERSRSASLTFGQVLQAMREGLSASTAELAAATGIRRRRLETIELGSLISQDEFDRLAVGFAWICGKRRRA